MCRRRPAHPRSVAHAAVLAWEPVRASGGERGLKCRTPLAPRARRIALILMDVDGVMTDGGISFIDSDREAKTYDAKDGVGLWIAHRLGLRTGLISGRAGAAVRRRA